MEFQVLLQVAGHELVDLRFGRIWILRQQRRGAHQETGERHRAAKPRRAQQGAGTCGSGWDGCSAHEVTLSELSAPFF